MMRKPEQVDREQLLSATDEWYAGQLSESGAAWLKEVLRNDLSACQTFVAYGDMLTSLSLHSATEDAESVEELVTTALEARTSMPPRSTRLLQTVGPLLATVGGLLVAAFFVFRAKEGLLPAARDMAPAASAPAVLPPPVAVLAEIASRRSIGGQRNVKPETLFLGMGFQAGDELHLAHDGQFVEVAFESGARLLVQGPADLLLESANSARLMRGRALGVVPPSAVGFTLKVPSGEVRDLGTEFAVDSSRDSTQLSVLVGRVDCELQAPGSEAQVARVLGNEALLLDPLAGSLTPLAGPPATLGGILDFRSGVVEVSKDVLFHRGPPPLPTDTGSVVPRLAQLYREQDKVSLGWEPARRELLVAQSADEGGATIPVRLNRLSRQAEEELSNAASVTVDSYLVRLKTPDRKPLQITGSVTFRQPIVGTITSPKGLMATDAALAYPEFAKDWQLHPDKARGSDEPSDSVEISPDGRTLIFTLLTTGAMDELRVLVRHPADEGLADRATTSE